MIITVEFGSEPSGNWHVGEAGYYLNIWGVIVQTTPKVHLELNVDFIQLAAEDPEREIREVTANSGGEMPFPTVTLSSDAAPVKAARNHLGHLICQGRCGEASPYAEPAANGTFVCRGCQLQQEQFT